MGNSCSLGCFVLSFFPQDVLDEIWDLIESVSEGFPTYLLLDFNPLGSYSRQSFVYTNFDGHHFRSYAINKCYATDGMLGC